MMVGGPGVAELCNPMWRPGGGWLAVDRCGEGDERRTWLISRQSGAAVVIPVSQRWVNWQAAIAWSPTGELLLVAESSDGGVRLRDTRIVNCHDPARPVLGRQVSGTALTHQACWSPDGQTVAVLEGMGGELAGDLGLGISIRALAGPGTVIYAPEDLVPVLLSW